jgi:hypothetical protein
VSAGPWANGVPAWLRWSQLSVGGVPFTCTTLTGTTLSGCVHPAFAVGTVVTFTRGIDNTTFTATLNNASAANANIVLVGGAGGFSTAQNFAATRTFFVGVDPVTCTGFTSTTLTGCTWPAGTALAVNDPVYTGATTTLGTPLIGGFIKIEQQRPGIPNNTWVDVTLEILNLGFAWRNQQGDDCGDPTPDAVIRMIRLRDNGMTANLCGAGAAAPAFSDYSQSLVSTDYWPLTLFDARESWFRTRPTNDPMRMGGLFSYVAIDGNNLRRWLAGTIGATGNQTLNNNGFIIYFSDRRGDHDETNGDAETGEYGHEDSINPLTAAATQTNALEEGENFNESRADPDDPLSAETMQTYGATPHPLAVPAGAIASMGFDAAQQPWSSPAPLLYSGRGRLARPVLFRRALKIINSGINAGVNSLPAGINFVAENPIYVEGNFNATAASVTAEPNVPAAIIGDSLTLLSNAFRDSVTFQFPNDQTNRNASDTGYRFAMVTGKSVPFPKPGWAADPEMGSDGGVHNFMKMLEDWSGRTLSYRGSMVSLYYSRQAIGIYRADANVYSPPNRAYNFDTDFLSPPLLPPGTPMFRDINTLKFRQILRPNQ